MLNRQLLLMTLYFSSTKKCGGGGGGRAPARGDVVKERGSGICTDVCF